VEVENQSIRFFTPASSFSFWSSTTMMMLLVGFD
jgi:hypothetical protein